MRSGVKTLTLSQLPILSRLHLSSVASSQVGVCTLVRIILCLRGVVVDAGKKRGHGAVTGTCRPLAPRLVLDLIQSVPLDVGGSQEQVGVAVVHQAHSAVTQTMTNSSRLVPEAMEPLVDITHLS